MLMKMVYPDGTYIIGKRHTSWLTKETQGTHHFIVVDTNIKELSKGTWIAVPINSVKYFELGIKQC